MKILRILLLASAAGMCGVATAAAQQSTTPSPATPSPQAIAAAKELIAIMSPDMIKDMNNKIFAQMWPAMEQALQSQFSKMDAATAAELKTEIRAEVEKEVLKEVTGLMDIMPTIYAHYLTADEMRDIQVFYRTPAGAKTLKVMPEILSEAMAGFAPRLQGMMQRINVTITGILQKRGAGPK
jgi:hypothetical protein